MTTQNEVEEYLDHLENVIDSQSDNGLLSKDTSESFHDQILVARGKLPRDITGATNDLHKIRIRIDDEINKNNSKKWIYLYGIHIWIILGVAGAIAITSLLKGWLNFPIYDDVSASIIAWSAIGGIAYTFYHLRRNIIEKQLTKYYTIYWLVYPFVGILFGLGAVFLLHAGFVQVEANPSYSVYVIISFLGGMFQEWIIGTMKDIAYAIHKPKS